EVAGHRNLHGAKHCHVQMLTANDSEGGRRSEVRGARQRGDSLFTRVDQIGVGVFTLGVRPDPEDAVFRVQDDGHALGDVVRDQGGHSDAEVDVLAVFELRGHPRGHTFSGPAHLPPLLLIASLCVVAGAVTTAPSPSRSVWWDWARVPLAA